MQKNIDLVSSPIKSFWKLVIPIVAFCLFDAFYGIVDMLWVSQLSVEALFAVGISIPFVTLIYQIGDSIGQGTNSIMSRFIGSGDYESAYNALIHGMVLTNVIWVIVIICLVFAHGVLYSFNQLDSYMMVFDYLIPMVVFAYLFLFVHLFSETLQAEGNSAIPNAIIIGTFILNIILDPIFIYNLNLGVKGAAYASITSSFIAFIAILFLYLSGRTKVPLSVKYFKFHTYIFLEIFKVTLPNIFTKGLECFSSAFINSILLITMGAPGPVLYTVCNKLKNLVVTPNRSNSRALRSVSAHMFGAEKFDGLKGLFRYVLIVTLIATLAVMIAFFLLRNYIFGLFSITGMENEIFWIAVGGTVYMMVYPFNLLSARMYDGFGKSVYTLIFSFVEVLLQVGITYAVLSFSHHGNSVLIAIVGSAVIIAIVYYVFLNYLFKRFDREFKEKSTVKNFDKQDESSKDIDDRIDDFVEDEARKLPSRIPLILALIAMVIVFIEIVSIPFKTQNYVVLISGLVSLFIGGVSVYYMVHLHKPKLAVTGFITVSIIILLFMRNYGYLAAVLFILAGITLLYINKILKTLKQLKDS